MVAKRKTSATKKEEKAKSPYKIGPGKDAEIWIDAYVERCLPALRPAAAALRRLVKKAVPKSQEAVNPWHIPTFDFHGPICFLMAGKHHITFGFPRGRWLYDSAKLLEGTGKNIRHVKVKDAAQLNEPGLRELLQESAALNRETPLTPSMRVKK